MDPWNSEMLKKYKKFFQIFVKLLSLSNGKKLDRTDALRKSSLSMPILIRKWNILVSPSLDMSVSNYG